MNIRFQNTRISYETELLSSQGTRKTAKEYFLLQKNLSINKTVYPLNQQPQVVTSVSVHQ
jgi:hypothetical protein